jgi:hypothetical protein
LREEAGSVDRVVALAVNDESHGILKKLMEEKQKTGLSFRVP